ncbi:MAG: PQQ-dependent sugar dehydrogenase [Planctomycetota bacterium]
MRHYQPLAVTITSACLLSVAIWLLFVSPLDERARPVRDRSDTTQATRDHTAATSQQGQQRGPESSNPPSDSAVDGWQRVAWTTSRVKGTPEPPPPYRTQRLFPTIQFKNPVVMEIAPGTQRLFVGEQSGKIFSFDMQNPGEPALVMDAVALTKRERPAGIDNSLVNGLEALYGLTFHPHFAENRYCYVSYVVKGEPLKDSPTPNQLPQGTRVSRFQVKATEPPTIDLDSEQIVISWLQGGHNGGCLAFGPDGYLYISTGDGGFANPPDGLNAGQDVSNLLSSVLRIDVDHPDEGKAYSIPKDNPFVSLAGARGEIWCYGLRNPWKMSFDRATGDLWIGDVGWELWELVYRAERGGNYGWSVVEGRQPVHVERKVGPTPILPPTIEIPHTDGVSITGGFVYRGKKFPELVGDYICGDWETRRIWAARWDEASKSCGPRRDLVEPAVRLVAFAEDANGELLLLDYDAGTIHELVKNEAVTATTEFPRKLSESGLFTSTADHEVAPGVVPFSVNVPQWSDGAEAQRYIALPDKSTVKILPQKTGIPGSMFSSSFVFPANSVLLKTISLQGRRLESQLLHFDGQSWRGYSYAWNEAQDDAELVEAVGRDQPLGDNTQPQTWHYASRVECARCHNQWAEYALAFQIGQLNRDEHGPPVHDNQLRRLSQLKVIELPGVTTTDEKPLPDRTWFADHFPRFANPYESRRSVDARARSYLHVNCAHCHRLGGGGTAYIELQHELPLEATKTLDVRPTQGTFDLTDARILAAGDPFRSTLFYRVAKTGSGRMPHIGSEIVDDEAVKLLETWIEQLPRHQQHWANVRRLQQLDESKAPASAQADTQKADAQKAERAKQRAELIEQALKSTGSALLIARSLVEDDWPSGVRGEVVAAAMKKDNSLLRDIFERFVPVAERERRLGSVIKPADILQLAGDAERGRTIFEASGGGQCKNCHRIGEVGGRLGPDLSKIGAKYPRHTLLEQILEPSKIIDPKYVSYLVQTNDGRLLTGLMVGRTDQEFVLRDAKDQEIRLAASDVETVAPQRQSLMPDLLLRDLTAQQVADLLAFLASRK